MKILQITDFSVGITILNQRIIYRDDIEFVTEFSCLLGHSFIINVNCYQEKLIFLNVLLMFLIL